MANWLRQEALPRAPGDLTASQWTAAADLVETLRSQLDELDSSKEKTSKIDRNRLNRLLFWSGAPGVGKSTAYFSVRHWVEEGIENRKGVQREKEDRTTAKRLAALGSMPELKARTKWLETLDLEPLTGHPNFLAAVLARIDDAFSVHEVEQATSATPRYAKFQTAQEEFQRLKTDIALSWEGNLHGRGSSLEPEVYAQEVMQAERARLNVNFRFRSVIAELAQHIDHNGRKPGLFVLPVDDLYLKPNVTMELLRFLRMISSPHLFVLVMGDMDDVIDLVFLHGIGEASQLMSSGGVDILDENSKRRIVKRSSAHAFSALQKLIPSSQTIFIDTMSASEVINYQSKFDEVKLGALLGLKKLMANPTETGSVVALKPSLPELSDVLEGWLHRAGKNSKTPDEQFSLDGWAAAPWLLDALQMSARHVSDIYLRLRSELDKVNESEEERQKAPWRAAMFVTEQIERALFEHSELGAERARAIVKECSTAWNYYQRRFPRSVKIRRAGECAQDVEFVYECLSVSGRQQGPGSTKEPIGLSALASAWLAILFDLLKTKKEAAPKVENELPWITGEEALPYYKARTFGELWKRSNKFRGHVVPPVEQAGKRRRSRSRSSGEE